MVARSEASLADVSHPVMRKKIPLAAAPRAICEGLHTSARHLLQNPDRAHMILRVDEMRNAGPSRIDITAITYPSACLSL
jgi:hypothetical protein